ncbi:MAG: transposase [Deltaproteobacteria bacterium]|nr:transposase [Deltaproteobacteria bacterium]
MAIAATPAPSRLAQAGAPSIYRPRHPERTAFYQLFEMHFDRYLWSYDERFEPRFGPLRSVVQPSVQAYLACGRLLGGFARVRCPSCLAEHLLAFSCQTRNFCASCQAKRAALLGERLIEKLFAPVPHAMWTFTIPKALRGLFQRERKLLAILSRCAYDALLETFQAALERKDVRPGCVTSIQTFGSFGANFHPHIHAIASAGAFTEQGRFVPLADVDPKVVEKVFRRLVLARLHRAKRLSEEFLTSLLSWQRSGFSAHADKPVEALDAASLERLTRYIARAPIRIDAIAIDDGRVRITTPPDPRSGTTELALDPLQWIHAITTQIPDRRQHLVRYYGAYASRTRGAGRFGARHPPDDKRSGQDPAQTLSPEQKRSRASWARLLGSVTK